MTPPEERFTESAACMEDAIAVEVVGVGVMPPSITDAEGRRVLGLSVSGPIAGTILGPQPPQEVTGHLLLAVDSAARFNAAVTAEFERHGLGLALQAATDRHLLRERTARTPDAVATGCPLHGPDTLCPNCAG